MMHVNDGIVPRTSSIEISKRRELRQQYTRLINQLKKDLITKEEFDSAMTYWCISNGLDWKEIKNNWNRRN